MSKTMAMVAVLSVVLVVAGMGLAQDGGARPQAVITETTFDFGEVFEQAEYMHVFVVKNKGKAELLIEDVKPG